MIAWFQYTALGWMAGFVLDLCFGDPHWMPHPVRLIGRMITLSETILRRIFPATKIGLRIAGAIQTVLVAGAACGGSLGILWLCWRGNAWLFFAVQAIFSYQILATKSLRVESMKVYKRLKADDLPGARRAVSMIVGRDTDRLDASEVAKAAVETVAENTCDGVIAPLFFLMLGGAPLGFLYKAVNTMDSMVGYRNEHYQYFGTAAAKTDDVLNWLPARLASWMMIAAAKLLGFRGAGALRIYRRDRRNHKSPNSAHTESVCAGALGVQLGGDAYYFGRLHQKSTIGDPRHPVTCGHIRAANRLLYGTAIGTALLFAGISAGILLPFWF